MDARWDDAEVRELCARHAELDPDVARRAYSARLLAAQLDLGAEEMGSASVKVAAGGGASVLLLSPQAASLTGLEVEQLCALDLAALRELAKGDPESVPLGNLLRATRLDPDAPDPASDAPLHAVAPARFVDQTYPSAVLALASQPDAELRLRALLGARVAWIAWTDSVWAAARAVAETCEKIPDLEAIVLQGRGLLSFADSARESFECALRIAGRAEAAVLERLEGGRLLDARPVVAMREASEVAHVLRGALAAPTGDLDAPFVHVVLDFRSSDEIAHFASAPLTPLLAAAMPPSQAHARLAGGSSLFIASPPYADQRKLRDALRREVEAYRRAWVASLERCSAARTTAAAEMGPLDPTPRAVLLPGIGLFGVGETRVRARVAAAAAEHAIRVKIRAATFGQYEGMTESAALQAGPGHLPAGARLPLTGQIALVAGATACGVALARALAAAGAELLLVDRDADALEVCARDLAGAEYFAADLADELDVRDALRAATERLGGVDILALDADALGSKSAELVGQALALLSAQGTGGSVTLVARDADVTELCQRTAREGAPANVRVNALALGPAAPENLLRMPITWEHAARAVVFLAARSVPITGQILLLDGGA